MKKAHCWTRRLLRVSVQWPSYRASKQSDELAPLHRSPDGTSKGHRDYQPAPVGRKGSGVGPDVRFGSEADICAAISHVRFTPNSDRKSGHPQTVMSALPLKADMCGAMIDVC